MSGESWRHGRHTVAASNAPKAGRSRKNTVFFLPSARSPHPGLSFSRDLKPAGVGPRNITGRGTGRGGHWEAHGPGSARPPLIPKWQPHSSSPRHMSRADYQGCLPPTVTQGLRSRGGAPCFLPHSRPHGGERGSGSQRFHPELIALFRSQVICHCNSHGYA